MSVHLSRREFSRIATAVPWLGSMVHVTDKTRALILSVRDEYAQEVIDCGVDALKANIQEALKKAGLGDLEVIILIGMDVIAQ